jgi:hypothetical protein
MFDSTAKRRYEIWSIDKKADKANIRKIDLMFELRLDRQVEKLIKSIGKYERGKLLWSLSCMELRNSRRMPIESVICARL